MSPRGPSAAAGRPSRRRAFAKACLHELLLYSGQFALFYLAMQLIVDGRFFLANAGHVGLLAALALQTALLAAFGRRPLPRAALTFVVPAVYSLLELREGSVDLFNAAHAGFWAYAAAAALLSSLRLSGGRRERASESALVAVNVFIFVFLYFYFDTWKDALSKDELTIFRIFAYLPAFLGDPTHWYIIAGGAILALTVALGRAEVASLKDRIFALFGKYVDRRVRDIIMTEGEAGSRRLSLCVLFSDIKDFTGLCEKSDPTAVTTMLNAYFEEWNRVVERRGGIVDKYIGDAIMVVFGLSDEGGACEAAAAAGADMIAAWPALRRRLAELGLPAPEGFGVGCHFGDLIFGNVGSERRRNFTVVGDTVNVAARLEAACRTEGRAMLVSSAVYERLGDDARRGFSRVGAIDLKGKAEGVEAWGYGGGGQRPPA